MQQGAAPAQEWRSPLRGQRIAELLTGPVDPAEREDVIDDLRAAVKHLRAAPTPEYVAGWLACQKEAAERVRRYWGADDAIRALAPPSAPPVSAPPDMVENTAPAAYCHGCGRALGKEEVHCDDCADELREDETSQNGTAVSDDRLLLLKALVARKAVMHTDCRPDIVAIEGGGVGLVCRIDPEGFPTLSPELRAALTEATHAV